MSTIHDQILTKIAMKYRNDPDGLECVASCLRNMRNGYYSKDYIDVVFQKWERFREYEFEDAVAFMLVHANIHLGKIAKTDIVLGCEPFSDKEVEANNTALRDGLADIDVWETKSSDSGNADVTCKFSGEFQGGLADDDGYIEWKGNANFWVFKDGKCDHLIEIPGRRVPLEVGYTKPGRTLLHLVQNRALARWPYGSKTLTILVVIDEDLWTPNF